MENHSVLIADSGSTKTDWAFMGMRMQTQGINPFHQDEDTIRGILKDELLPQLTSDIRHLTSILFYGSGVRPELEEKMIRLLAEAFPQAEHIEAHGDLLGAARALCGNREGIACILGTGANSCLYDGERIVENTPPMGYILGDEGSGAVLGVRFLNALYKNRLSNDVKVAFEAYSGMSMAQVIERVYRQPMANRWLASLSAFIHEQIGNPQIEQLVIDNFRDFIQRNIAPYQRKDLPINAVGSIAFYYQQQLEKAVKEEGYTLGKIVRSPLDALVEME
jgi:N-acetylglucosamine kinase-like BadF-type ATPase